VRLVNLPTCCRFRPASFRNGFCLKQIEVIVGLRLNWRDEACQCGDKNLYPGGEEVSVRGSDQGGSADSNIYCSSKRESV
jgi:hypothetical protein